MAYNKPQIFLANAVECFFLFSYAVINLAAEFSQNGLEIAWQFALEVHNLVRVRMLQHQFFCVQKLSVFIKYGRAAVHLVANYGMMQTCLLYTSDAADD